MSVAIPTASVRVLVVEDSEDQQVLTRRHFERAGCDVHVAGTAEAAILAYTNDEPDLIVIDLLLPGMNGWELVDKVREARPNCVVAVTSVLDPREFPDDVASLPKPFTGAQVRQVLGDHVPKWTDK